MTFALLIAGGLVTSTDSGLSVPDWPLSYGRWFPPMVGGILYEHTHRMIAAVVGLLIAVLAGWLRFAEPRRWVRRLGYGALLAVMVQALLGGLTVLWMLPPPVSIAHACLGPLVFCLVASVALVTSRAWHVLEPAEGRGWSRLALACALTTAVLGAQLLLGAVVRHTGVGVGWHVATAGLVIGSMGRLLWRLRDRGVRRRSVVRLGHLLAVGLLVQILLGLLVLQDRASVLLTTAHQALGALLLATASVLTWMGCRISGFRPEGLELLGAFVELTKPRLTLLALVSTAAGFVLASASPPDGLRLLITLLGAALVGGGANALNQYLEREPDALMARTKSRPLPSGRLNPQSALWCGLVLSVIGVAALAGLVNLLAAALSAGVLATYVGLYTPLKRTTSLCTLVGAVPGALPPLIGWAASRGELGLGAWVLFAILFLWQLPHFLAIAWMHRDEYARAGFQMLSVTDPGGASASRQMVLYGAALLPISLLPTVLGLAGPIYFVGALGAGVWFVGTAAVAARWRSRPMVSKVFLGSVGYLSLILLLMVLDKTPIVGCG